MVLVRNRAYSEGAKRTFVHAGAGAFPQVASRLLAISIDYVDRYRALVMHYKLDTKVLDKITRENPDNVSRFGRAVAQDINSDIVQSFGTSIAPVGEPPGVDTGALRASMKVRQISKFVYYVEDGVIYGIVHELALNGYPRPFVRPAFERAQRKFIDAAKAWGLFKP